MNLDPDAPFEVLSSGLKRRVLLARGLACDPDILLLDEPTNHLDIDAITWLEDFLLRYGGTLLFVTHDRMFLRKLATRIIELDRGSLVNWSCDYDTFLQRKQDVLDAEAVQWNRFDKKLAQEEIWIRQGIKARRTRNEGRVRALEKMREIRRARPLSCGSLWENSPRMKGTCAWEAAWKSPISISCAHSWMRTNPCRKMSPTGRTRSSSTENPAMSSVIWRISFFLPSDPEAP